MGERPDPRPELLVGVGLRQVVVRAGAEPLDHLLAPLLGGQEQDRHPISLRRAGAEEAADLEARDPGHQPVEHDDVGPGRTDQLLDGGRAVLEHHHAVVVPQRPSGPLGVEGAVVDDPDARTWLMGVPASVRFLDIELFKADELVSRVEQGVRWKVVLSTCPVNRQGAPRTQSI